MIDTNNQKTISLRPTEVEVLDSLDPVKELDEIRMVGVMSGLIRIRDYGNRVSVQFYATPAEIGQLLQSVVEAMPNVTRDRFPYLTIQNLYDDTVARIHLPDLAAKLDAGEPVLRPVERVAYNEALRERMKKLLGRSS